MKWKIKNKNAMKDGKRIYWSSQFGWTWLEQSDTFTDEEKKDTETMLPMGGEWEEYDGG